MDDSIVKQNLKKGAWDEGLAKWKEEIDNKDLELVRKLDLLEEFEFFWDENVDRVGYEAPSIPSDWKAKEYSDVIESWAQVSRINVGLNELGSIVREILEEKYLDL